MRTGFWFIGLNRSFKQVQLHIRVLLPDITETGVRCPVLYVLPVEAGDGSRYGDGLAECRRSDVHNRYGVIFHAATSF